ncbi:MAG: glyoxalase superfamily protein [Rhizobiaceae bacterium]
MRNIQDAKGMAKAIRAALAERQIAISHSDALEIVARQFSFDNWNVLVAKLDKDAVTSGETAPSFTQPVPIFRIFDEEKARGFYEGFLDCTVDWQHRFHPGAPLYCQVSRGGLKLHLSEHSGDASPGATAVCTMKGVEAFQKGLLAKNYKYNRPGLERQDWGLECEVIDPFGNRIRFMEQGT